MMELVGYAFTCRINLEKGKEQESIFHIFKHLLVSSFLQTLFAAPRHSIFYMYYDNEYLMFLLMFCLEWVIFVAVSRILLIPCCDDVYALLDGDENDSESDDNNER